MATRKPINARAKLPEQLLRAAIYIRVSGDEQEEDGYSLESQEKRCKQYCREQGYTHDSAHFYSETFTGKVYRQRPVLSAMRAAARRREFDVLVIYAYDRLARKQVHQAVIIDDLEYHHVKIESVKEHFEDSAVGRHIRSTYAFAAEFEHENILERTERGRVERVQQGKLVGSGRPLYGYYWNKDHSAYLIDPEESKVVKRIFELYDQGNSIRAIARQLTEEGIPTRKGEIWRAATIKNILNNTDKRIVEEELAQRILEMHKSGDSLATICKELTEEGIPTPKESKVWRAATVAYILSHPAYTGKAVALRYRAINEPGQPSKIYIRPSEEQVKLPDGVIPALVDKELFERVQARLPRNKELSPRNNKNPQETLLRCGLVVCAHCGGNMSVERNYSKCKENCTNYRCNKEDQGAGECKGTRISTKILDAAVWKRIEEVLRDPELVEEKLKAWKKKLEKEAEKIKKELEPIDRKIAEIDKKRKNIQKSLEDDMDDESRVALNARLQELALEKKGLLEERKQVLGAQVDHEKEQEKEENFRQWCAKKRAELDDPEHEADYEWKREACERFGVMVLVGRPGSDKKRYDITFIPPELCPKLLPIFAPSPLNVFS